MKTLLTALFATIALRDPDLVIKMKGCELACTCTTPSARGSAIITQLGDECPRGLLKKVWRVCHERCGDGPGFMVKL